MIFLSLKNRYGYFLYFEFICSPLPHTPPESQSILPSILFTSWQFRFYLHSTYMRMAFCDYMKFGSHKREQMCTICLMLASFTQFDYLQLFPFLANGMISIFFMAESVSAVLLVDSYTASTAQPLGMVQHRRLMSKHPWLRVLEVNAHEQGRCLFLVVKTLLSLHGPRHRVPIIFIALVTFRGGGEKPLQLLRNIRLD